MDFKGLKDKKTGNVYNVADQEARDLIEEKVPSSGTTGYVLKKTDDGTEWDEINRIGSVNVGSASQPIYLSAGVPTATNITASVTETGSSNGWTWRKYFH